MTEAWTQVTSDALSGLRLTRHCVVSHKGYIYLVGGSNASESTQVWRSADGETWEMLTDAAPWTDYASDGVLLATTGYLWFIVAGPGGDYPHLVYRSADGVTWTEVFRGSVTGSSYVNWGGFVSGDDLYLVFLDSAEINVLRLYRSADGATWTKIGSDYSAPVNHNFNKIQVAFDGTSIWLQVSDDDQYGGDNTAYVLKGALTGTWEIVTDAWAYRQWACLVCFEDEILALGGVDHYGDPGRTWYHDHWTSSDGVAWTQQTTPAWTGRQPVALEHCGALFVVGCWDAESEEPAPPGPYPLVDVWRLGDYVPYVPPHVPAEHDWWEFACTPYGSLRDPSLTIAHDFTRALVFDLALGKVYPAWGFPMASTLNNSSPCAGPAQTPTGMFAGTADGYVAKLMGPDCYGLGTPCRRIAWALDAGCTDTILQVLLTEDEDFLPTYWVSGSAPEVRAGQLAGLPVVIEYADGSEAAGVIADNTNDTITLTGALTVTPAAGDVVLISPMTCGAWFAEARFQRPAAPRALYVDGYNNQSGPQLMTLDIFSAEGAGVAVEHTVAAANRDFLMEDTRIGDGRIALPGLARKALMYGLWFRPVGGGYLQIDGLRVRESVR